MLSADALHARHIRELNETRMWRTVSFGRDVAILAAIAAVEWDSFEFWVLVGFVIGTMTWDVSRGFLARVRTRTTA